MPRKLSNIIAEICKFYEETEVPDAFALWSGIFAVSACMGRDCFIDQGHIKIYPNIYLILTGGSGVVRKSTAINIVSELLENLDPPIDILSQRITPEALIGALSKRVSKEQHIVEEAVGYFIADEISTLIDKTTGMAAMIPILTKLYDGKNFDYETKSRGKEFVKNPCLGILGGSTLEWIKESFPTHSIAGGFTARVIFVHRKTVNRRIPWLRRSKENSERLARIQSDLNRIRKLRGLFGVTDEAIEVYSKEYISFLNGELAKNSLTSRYAARRHTTLLKIAMIYSASQRDTREVTEEDMYRSILIMEGAEKGRDQIMRKIISEPVGDLCDFVMGIIASNGKIARGKLLYETRHRMTARDLNIILEGGIEGGYVMQFTEGGRMMYRMKRKEERDG